MKAEKNPRISNRNNWLFIGVTVLFAGIVAYKVAVSPITIDLTDFKFSDMLSVVLALFAIAISLVFYFKARETSNQFYDNTYKFTKEISEILGRIEAGFGERLKHLDEGYAGIRDLVERMPIDPKKTENAIKEEEDKVKKSEQERKELLDRLADRAKMEDKEKEQMFKQLDQKDFDLANAKGELSYLKTKHIRAMDIIQDVLDNLPSKIIRLISDDVIPEYGTLSHVLVMSDGLIQRDFIRIRKRLDQRFIRELQHYGLLNEDGELSTGGIRTFRRLVELKLKRQ